jgi:hypothetical protein
VASWGGWSVLASALAKRGVKAAEREEFLRAARRVMVTEGKDVREFVLVDECGTHTSLWLPSTGIGLGQSEFTRT